MSNEHVWVSDFLPGMKVHGIYLMTNIEKRRARNGKEYLRFKIVDQSASIDANLWELTENTMLFDMDSIDEAEIMYTKLTVEEYMGTIQARANGLKLIENPDKDLLNILIPSAPIDAEAYFEEIHQRIQQFQNPELKKIMLTVLSQNKEGIMDSPAAERLHHATRNGLLFHVYRMIKVAEGIAKAYEVIDGELLICGVILHDIGKLKEYTLDKFGLVERYSVEGNLYGHLVSGAMYVENLCDELQVSEETKRLLVHMILSHHGQKEWGSPVFPAIPEAHALHHIDKLDATIFLYEEEYAHQEEGTFSDPVFFLDRTKVYKKKS